jgi:hypothetical protein
MFGLRLALSTRRAGWLSMMFLRWQIKFDILCCLTSHSLGSIEIHRSQCWWSAVAVATTIAENEYASVMVVVRGGSELR